MMDTGIGSAFVPRTEGRQGLRRSVHPFRLRHRWRTNSLMANKAGMLYKTKCLQNCDAIDELSLNERLQ
jgi:hypothetical protein